LTSKALSNKPHCLKCFNNSKVSLDFKSSIHAIPVHTSLSVATKLRFPLISDPVRTPGTVHTGTGIAYDIGSKERFPLTSRARGTLQILPEVMLQKGGLFDLESLLYYRYRYLKCCYKGEVSLDLQSPRLG
jgi:hypothetical protein